MLRYILRRLALMIPTLFGIMVVNFAVIQAAPGGPVERVMARLQGLDGGATARVGGAEGGDFAPALGEDTASLYRGARGLDPTLIAQLERQFGFDKPAHVRFIHMISSYMRFDFGSSFYRDESVVDLLISKLPVSISLGLWTTLLVYAVSIPLGVRKAIRQGSRFDVWTSGIVIVGYAVPAFLFAILLIVLFAGGHFFDWFPLRGLTSSTTSGISACPSCPWSSAALLGSPC